MIAEMTADPRGDVTRSISGLEIFSSAEKIMKLLDNRCLYRILKNTPSRTLGNWWGEYIIAWRNMERGTSKREKMWTKEEGEMIIPIGIGKIWYIKKGSKLKAKKKILAYDGNVILWGKGENMVIGPITRPLSVTVAVGCNYLVKNRTDFYLRFIIAGFRQKINVVKRLNEGKI